MINKETYELRYSDKTKFVTVVRTQDPRKERRELFAEVCGQYKNIEDLIIDALNSTCSFDDEEQQVDAYQIILDDRETKNFKKKENNRVARMVRAAGLDESAFLEMMPKIAKVRVYGHRNSI